MRHSNQPSSSRVSRSTSREAPRFSDTRPLGRKGGVAEGSQRKGRRAEGGKVNAHNQTGVVSKCRAMGSQSGRTGIQCHKGHSQSQRLACANGQNACNRTHERLGYDRRRRGKGGAPNTGAWRSQRARSASAKPINHWSEDGNHQRYKLCPVIKVMGTGGGLGSACQKCFI